MPRVSRIEVLLFLLTFVTFAWFHQGGGWNQNSRLAEVRAIVEQGRFAIDDYFVYLRDPAREELARVPVRRAEYDFGGVRHRLCWVDSVWTLVPIGEHPLGEGVKKAGMIEVCSSGDVAYVERTGHFHPNKPPGTSLLAVPAYFVIYHVERALGIHPDHWWTLNLNAWLTTIFSVGLVSALSCVLFFRLACEFAGGAQVPAVLATLALAFGTTFFSFGTILFDHNLTAGLLLASFYCLREKTSHPVAAGFCAGFAVVTNYVAAGAVVALGLYALLAARSEKTARRRNWPQAWRYALGGLGPALLLGWYHTVNFGSPLALANDFQNPLFKNPDGSLGMFTLPNPYVAALLAVSPYRGIFWLAPVLVLGVAGWVVWLREKTFPAEARLGLAIFGWFFLVNASFNGYHGGYAAGPRYLVPALPFLALPLAIAFVRWKKIALILLVLSVGQQFLLTATDAQNSLAVGGHARVDDAHRKDDFFCSIVGEYAAPLFFTGHIGPLTEQLLALRIEKEEQRLSENVADEAERARQIEEMRRTFRAAVDRGDRDPIMLAAIRGPVSVNSVNVFDGLLGYGIWPLHSPQAEWASFNAGEFVWPRSRRSLLPLLIFAAALTARILNLAHRADAAKGGVDG